MIKKDDCFLVGRFIKTHGFKGELNIKLDVDYPEEYSKMESTFVEINKELVPFFFESFRLKQNGIATVKVEGIDSDTRCTNLGKKKPFFTDGFAT